MRRIIILMMAALLAVPLLAVPAGAQEEDATLSVVHGVPGLTVDVYANGALLLEHFEPESIESGVSVPAGTYDIEVFATGADPEHDSPAISAPGIEVSAGINASIVAHLDEGGSPTASVFVNDVSDIADGEARVTVRHTAAAPAVDVLANGGVLVPNLANGAEGVADVPADTYAVALNAAGTDTQAFPASGALDVELAAAKNTIVYAVFNLGSDFTLLVDTLDLSVIPEEVPAAGDGYALVDVVHGVPGLTVDVYANGEILIPGFEPETIVSQVLLPAGTYDIAIYAAGADPEMDSPAIAADGIVVPKGGNVAIVAHLDEGGSPTASVFVNDVSDIADGEARVTVRHTAAAPAVDVLANGGVLVPNLANGAEGVADVPADTYAVALNAAGTDTQAFPASGALDVALEEGVNTIVYAVFNLGSDFTVLVSTIEGLGDDGAFDDVKDSVHKKNITLMALAGVARGYGDGTYGPGDGLTRGQMAALVRRALSLPASSTDYFTDDDGTTFEGDINAIAEAGITFGYGDGTFGPNDAITRGQMAAFLNRAFGFDDGGDTPFTDIDGSVFEGDIEAIFAAGVTAGTSDTTYSPDDQVSRGQMASFLARSLGLGS